MLSLGFFFLLLLLIIRKETSNDDREGRCIKTRSLGFVYKYEHDDVYSLTLLYKLLFSSREMASKPNITGERINVCITYILVY